MSGTTDFIVEGHTVTIFGDSHAKFGEDALTDFTGSVTVPFSESTNAGAFRPEWKITGYRFKRRC